MDTDQYLTAVDREGQALAAAARRGVDLDVPHCAGWTVHDVVGHMARVYKSVTEVVVGRFQEPPPRLAVPAPEGAAVVPFFEDAHGALVSGLAGIDADEPVWTWSGQGQARFYQRRMAHETAVHRCDTEAAHGGYGPIDADLAVDGIDEYLDVVLPFSLAKRDVVAPSGSLHLHRTDGEGEWMIRGGVDGLMVSREHGKGDAAVRATASDLMLLVWNRCPFDDLEHFGDADVAREWAALAP